MRNFLVPFSQSLQLSIFPPFALFLLCFYIYILNFFLSHLRLVGDVVHFTRKMLQDVFPKNTDALLHNHSVESEQEIHR
jgi:hypothetical protein